MPLQCDEPADFSTFRIGPFGLDKLGYVEKVAQARLIFSDRTKQEAPGFIQRGFLFFASRQKTARCEPRRPGRP